MNGEAMRRTSRVAVALLTAGALAVGVTGTAVAAKKPTPLQVASGYMKFPTKITQKLPLKTKAPSGLKIACLTNGASAINTVCQGVSEAAAATGNTSFNVVAANISIAAQIETAMNSALQQGATAIIAPTVEPNTFSAAMRQRFIDGNIPVVVGQTCVTYPIEPPFYAGALMCENEAAVGKSLAAWTAADSNSSNAHVLWENVSGFPVQLITLAEFKKALAAWCSSCTVDVLQITIAQYAGNQVPSMVVNRLRANPSLQYVFFDNGLFFKGLPAALDAAGLLGKVKVGGKSMDPIGQQALKDGQAAVWTAQAEGTKGDAYIDSLFRVLTKSPGTNLNFIQPLQLVTTVNVRSLPDPYIYAPTDSLAQFKKLWKVS
jgi:ribose transport system substrate-binding protein